jgi:hypothetical protein
MATEQKGRWMIARAAGSSGRDAAGWAEALRLCAQAAERLADGAPDQSTRHRAAELLRELRAEQENAQRRAGELARTESGEIPARNPERR